MSNTKKRALEAASMYLKHRGYDVIETNWKHAGCGIDLIAKDGDILVLADVAASTGRSFPAEERSSEHRSKRETAALTYLATSEERDVTVRFDVISMLPIDEDRYIVRHHINSLGVPDDAQEPALAEAA